MMTHARSEEKEKRREDGDTGLERETGCEG